MIKKSLLIVGLALPCLAQAQNISTIGGSGTGGFSGDGAAATAAKLNGPSGVAVDLAGNVYVADAYNHRVRKIAKTGTISTIAGKGTAGFSGNDGAATAAELKNPTGVAVDNAGNVYVLDFGNNCIRKITTSGNIVAYAGDGALGFAGDGGAATAAKLYQPAGMYMDAANNLFIADGFNHRVRKVDAAGVITTVAGSGVMGSSGDGGGALSAKLNAAAGVGTDASGNIYIADKSNHRIRKVDASGTISTLAGNDTAGYTGDGGTATAAKLNKPLSIKADAAGNLYVVDMGNNRIRKIAADGTIATIAGTTAVGYSGDGGPATAAAFTWPADVALDTAGNIYIADQGNNCIRKISKPSAAIAQVQAAQPLHVFPNPSAGSFLIELPVKVGAAVVTITDATGRIVERRQVDNLGTQYTCTLAHPVSGLYHVAVVANATTYAARLFIQ